MFFVFIHIIVNSIFMFLFAGGLRGLWNRIRAVFGAILIIKCWPAFVLLAIVGLFEDSVILSVIFALLAKYLLIPLFTNGHIV